MVGRHEWLYSLIWESLLTGRKNTTRLNEMFRAANVYSNGSRSTQFLLVAYVHAEVTGQH